MSRCCTIETLRLSARAKCTHYNATAMLDDTLIHDTANFTVDALAASLAAQRQQLPDLFDYVELHRRSSPSRPNSPEALTGH